MRDAFFNELFELFVSDGRVAFVTGDLGYKLFDGLKAHDPSRVFNAGIREAGMVGFAAGLVRTGMLPFVYSIAPFITLRCLEQIKICLSYNLNRVVLVGVGGGYCYGHNGATHFGLEDVNLMSAIPHMTVWTPADPLEVRACVRATPELSGPAYLRLGRNGEPVLRGGVGPVSAWKAWVEPNKGEGAIVTNGFLLSEVRAAVESLRERGLSPAIIHLPCTEPLDQDALLSALSPGTPVLTVEEHFRQGGLGQKIALLLAETGLACPMASLSAPVSYPKTCMSRGELLAFAGLDAPSIARAFEGLWARRGAAA